MNNRSFNLFCLVLIILVACKDNVPRINKNQVMANNTYVSVLKETTKIYLNAWSEYDTLLQQSITIQKVVRNVNGENVSYNQHELFKSMHFWYRAMPDIKIIDKEITVIENRTYVNWVSTGTNTGMFGDIPPTGKVGQTNGISILTFNDAGKIVHEIAYFDMLSLMEELGYTLESPVMN
ncbi:ester cyclase [Maribacter hydrothermalis]|uniref:SnoaL-like polyketide cyclase n=1 Tax=Maribacter hydrothermalis TaxID=1836467 RepID=A0A1B7ZBV9_9FLAO|nr:ester cyclase [Maribacter hydrothermalis]APQ15983.1 hypothetical protein BTR34_00890 [Maribacter hydrothermalis]OBR40400.1 hypothetical protein A9200_16095 [Maribacter hydrothermalis]